MVLLRPFGGARRDVAAARRKPNEQRIKSPQSGSDLHIPPLPLGNAIYIFLGPKTWPQAFRSTVEAFHLTRKRKEVAYLS